MKKNEKESCFVIMSFNKKLQNGKLQVKIWDNVNKEKQDVLFERI